ncbi:CHAT domain-containing protein, partial [Anaerolineales bacterium HSG24]|nr:CHAT domain-containing protein [Anaerolineales bacterium HSG24]
MKICIKQSAPLSADGPNASLSFDDGGSYPISVQNPFDEQTEDRLRWYFEEHLKVPFFKQVKAKRAAESVPTYGEALFEQVFKADADAYADYKTACQQGLPSLQFEIIGDPDFHSLHWEALKDPNRGEPFVLHSSMVRRGEQAIRIRINPQESPTINLLVVTARPKGRFDVGFRTISRPLVEGIRQANLPVNIDIVRPGSYRAVLEALKAKPVGYYHIIHFDLHGAVLTHEQLTRLQGVSQHTYDVVLLKERYGRPDLSLPSPDLPQAYLIFEANRPDKLFDVAGASELADLLREYQIPIAILNACQSGMQTGQSVEGEVRETSLGSRLLQAGIQTVLAMGYSITVSAAQLLMTTLYRSLFEHRPNPTEQHDLLVAIREGRAALHHQKERRAYHQQMIKLEDWLLPVVYQGGGQTPRRLPLRAMSFQEKALFLSQQPVPYQPSQPTYGFVGRDVDILELEKRVLRQEAGERHNILLLQGLGGAGKTTLLHHVGAWWQKTGLVQEVIYFGYDLQAYTVDQLLDTLAQRLFNQDVPLGMVAAPKLMEFRALTLALQQQFMAEELRAKPHLLILDNLESITGQPLAIRNTLPPLEQQRLQAFLRALWNGKTIVLLGSRSDEVWLTSPHPPAPSPKGRGGATTSPPLGGIEGGRISANPN